MRSKLLTTYNMLWSMLHLLFYVMLLSIINVFHNFINVVHVAFLGWLSCAGLVHWAQLVWSSSAQFVWAVLG
uniref:Uncharacterized protein n=1 Tax=Octopus bimaculoides TaxID=37653 RepID=A0A0L8FGS6_OCTBM